MRSRTARACWKYKNNILKRAKCFAKHTRDYKGELAKGLLADEIEKKDKTQKAQESEEEPEAPAQSQEQQPQQQPIAAAEGSDDDEEENALVSMDHVNERELSSASSTDSD